MKRFIWIAVIIIIIAGVVWWFKRPKPGDAEEAPKLTELPIEKGSIVQKVESTGVVAANLEVEIKCKASGEIIGLPFDISDTVLEGDLLVELDPVDEQRNLEIAQVSLTQAQANLAKARQNLEIAENDLATARQRAELDLETARLRAEDERAKADRVADLYAKGFAGQEEYDAAQTAADAAEATYQQALLAVEALDTQEAGLELRRQDVRLAEAQLESSRINLSIIKQRLEDTRVYSPMDGVVTARPVQIGQIISSGISSTSGGTTILILSDMTRLFVLASVDESDIGTVQVGQRVAITVDAFPGVNFDGIVDRIAQKGTNNQSVVTFEVKIEIKSDNMALLKPEMTANVEIFTIEKDGVIAVPVNAVTRNNGNQIVTVKKSDGSSEERVVETGINNGTMIEITSGLSEGETILIDESSMSSRWRNNDEGNRPSPPPMGFGGGMMRPRG